MPDTTRTRGRPKAFVDQSEQNRIRALDRALDVLELLSQQSGMTLTGIATTMGQSPATIYRVLSTLQLRGMVEAEAADQTWHIGSGAFRLGAAFLRRTTLVERARPVMRDLMQDTGETANLGIEKGDHVLFLSQVETHHSIRAFFAPGTMSPLHASGIGKALLARAPDKRLQALLAKGLQVFTEKTLDTTDKIHRDIEATRARGYALDDEERTEGMRCVAAPILNLHGEAVAGISVSGPVTRMTLSQVEVMGASVLRAAQSLSQSLGAPVQSGP